MCFEQLNTVMNADKIVVLANGSVAESGRHQELLEQGGIYAELWSMQHGEAESQPDDEHD
mgnify:CR=1 FL=1